MPNDQFVPPLCEGENNKHQNARSLVEAAFRTEDEGERKKAERLFRRAQALIGAQCLIRVSGSEGCGLR